ncbi:MAG: HD domain-containing protein [Desulfovibrionales bacterium]
MLDELKQFLALFEQQCPQKHSGTELIRYVTESFDKYFRWAVNKFPGEKDPDNPFILLAVGGYGRQELCLCSDRDVLLVFENHVPEWAGEFASCLFTPLWDLKQDVAHAVRTADECIELAQNDPETMISQWEMRFLAGSRQFYESFSISVENNVRSSKDKLLGIFKEQFFKAGDPAGLGLLEPDLKNSPGGLRDIHRVFWAARLRDGIDIFEELETAGSLPVSEFADLKVFRDRLIQTRNHLHCLGKRKNDVLYLEMQPDIASCLGYSGSDHQSDVELFLAEFQDCIDGVRAICGSYWRSLQSIRQGHDVPWEVDEGVAEQKGELGFVFPESVVSEPSIVFRLFTQSAQTGLPLSWETRRLLRDLTHSLNKTEQTNMDSCASRHTDSTKNNSAGAMFLEKEMCNNPLLFLDILGLPHAAGALNEMLETRILGALFPDFARVRNLVQYDTYHIHPCGRHLVTTFGYVKQAERTGLPEDLCLGLRSDKCLLLAALFHDIGKPYPDHAARGAAIMSDICSCLGLSEEDTADIVFWVKNHLLLVETAFRRDIEDHKVITDLALKVKTIRRLAGLTILTWADSKATGPRAWSKWHRSVINELFFKVLSVLERGLFARPYAIESLETVKEKLLRTQNDKFDDAELSRLLEAMPPDYLLQFSVKELENHLELVRRLFFPSNADEFAIHFEKDSPSENFHQIIFVGEDSPGLFFRLCGAVSLAGFNILSAQINVWDKGIVVDVLQVSGQVDPLYPDEKRKRIEENIRRIFEDRLDPAKKLSAIQLKTPSTLLPGVHNDSQVCLNQEESEFWTIIETKSYDRIGLLYFLGKCLNDLRLDIGRALIATHSDQIVDVFYVVERGGGKVNGSDREKEIVCALQEVLDYE